MPIIKAYKPIKKTQDILLALEYSADIEICKSEWYGKVLPIEERIATYGLPPDPVEAAKEILLVHECYGRPGKNLAYKILIDMEGGVIDPWQMRRVAWDINEFLRVRDIQYYQGTHCNTAREKYHPHVHTVMSGIYPMSGKKVNLNHAFLMWYKYFANMVLFRYGLPLIKIGIRSIPINFMNEEDIYNG